MRLYENEAKQVFAREGIAVPRALGVCEKAEDVGQAVGERAAVMLKALVLIGGRGKAGGVRRAAGRAEAVSLATDMLGRRIRGYPVERLLVEEAVETTGGAVYIGVTMNPADFNVTVIVSPAGGIDIEQVARTPDRILRIELAANEETLPDAEASGWPRSRLRPPGGAARPGP
jgi:succinyl-CoA synthetase beta subunit